jgi:chaperonin GroEL (HSP60 family)
MVTRSALQNAASIGSLIVTTEVVVAEPEEAGRGGGNQSRYEHGPDVRSSGEAL